MKKKKVFLSDQDMEPTNDKSLIISTKTNVISSIVRPSSPRQFFERIYGHLENTTAISKNVFASEQSELSSSPDISNDR